MTNSDRVVRLAFNGCDCNALHVWMVWSPSQFSDAARSGEISGKRYQTWARLLLRYDTTLHAAGKPQLLMTFWN